MSAPPGEVERRLERVARILGIDSIRYNPINPRERVDAGQLADLAESIAANGLLQPIEVRPLGDGTYEAVYGNTRLRAYKELLAPRDPARWGHIGCFVAEISDMQAFIRSWEENDKRADLSQADELHAVEHALGIGLTVARDLPALRRIFRRSESWVRRRARLAALPELRARIVAGSCTIDDAFEALSAAHNDPARAAALLERAHALDLSRRDFRTLLRTDQEEARAVASPADPARATNLHEKRGTSPGREGAASPGARAVEGARAPAETAPTPPHPPVSPTPAVPVPPAADAPSPSTPTAARAATSPAASPPATGTFAGVAEELADGLEELAALALATERRLPIRTLATAQLLANGRLVTARDLLLSFRTDLLTMAESADR